MVTRTPLVAGNWKMHGSLQDSEALVSELCAGIGSVDEGPQMLLCPSYVYLQAVRAWLHGSSIRLGAQNLAESRVPGAFTGEVSGAMLREFGCEYVIVGHSERRALFGDTDERVAAKFGTAQSHGLKPILCVGETLEERETDKTQSVIERQLEAVLGETGVTAFASAVVAYEPVWAIGTGRTATPDQAQEVHEFIRSMIRDRDATIAAGLQVLYGGSVKGANAKELFAMDDIDGGLVGGASLEAQEFLTIFQAA